MKSLIRVYILSATVACQAPQPPSSGAVPNVPGLQLDVTVRPLRAGTSNVVATEVRQELRSSVAEIRPLTWRIGIVYTGRAGIADRVDSLAIRDAAGVVPFVIENDPENKSGYTYYRRWRAQRALKSPVVLSYRMRAVPRPTGGPQYELYSHAGGISGHGSQLFVLPESLGTADMRVTWDLRDLATGSTAATTFAPGNVRLRGRVDTLVTMFYLAGPLGRYDPPKENTGFEAYWLGRLAFNPHREMAWLFQSYENMRAFYGNPSNEPYRVFLRGVGRGGGTASGRSFMGAVEAGTEDSTKQAPRTTIAHEIGHFFVGQLRGGQTGSTPWYGEGVNTHYTRLLLLRAGLATPTEFLTDANNNARGYYTNPFRGFTADSIRLIGYSTGFGGASAQNLAYTRGSLFWAEVDLRIRNASSGHRKLDDVLLPLIQARERGAPFTQDVLFGALSKELPSFRPLFDSVITRAAIFVPQPGIFGSCFRRVSTRYPVQGQSTEVDGVMWERVPTVPDSECRKW